MTTLDTRAVLQSLLNTSVAHVRRQGRPSTKEGGCFYLSPDGMQCAAAPFILKYSPSMEGKDWTDVVANTALDEILPEARENVFFVVELQQAHDCASVFDTPEQFLSRYEHDIAALASRHGLSVPERV